MVSDGAKATVLITSLVLGFSLFMVAIFVPGTIWALVFGAIFLTIGLSIWGYASSQSRRPHNDYGSSFYTNRWGSANAKRNMWRGHRYSSATRKRG